MVFIRNRKYIIRPAHRHTKHKRHIAQSKTLRTQRKEITVMGMGGFKYPPSTLTRD